MTSNNTNKHLLYSPTSILNNSVSVSSTTGSLILSGGLGVGDTINIRNSIGSLGYMYSGVASSTVPGSTTVSTNVKTMNNRIRTSRANANNCVSTWTTRVNAVDNGWWNICWSPELGIFVTVAQSGTGNRVMTSPDGVVWTIRASAADNVWNGICWSPELGIFVAVATSGTGNRVMTSSNGITWTVRVSAADNGWASICWSPELGIFVAVAWTGSGNRIMTSPDGINWTTRVSAVDNNWRGVCWSPELGIFVAIAASGTGNRAMTSPDGINWTSRNSAIDNNWISICWSPELGIFVAVSDNGAGNRVMTSPDGVTWTVRVSAADNGWASICWNPELGIFVAVSYSGSSNRVMTSSDGINWVTRLTAVNNNWFGVCWSPELSIFVAVSTNGASNQIMTSAIGIPSADGTILASPAYVSVNNSTGSINIANTTQLGTNASTMSATSGALTVQGDLHFYNGTKNTIVFPQIGLGPPTYTNRSVGTKIVLYPSISASDAGFAIGMDTATLWYSVGGASGQYHKFYSGTTLNTQIGNNQFWIPLNTASSSATTGALVVTGGVGISGDNYIAGIYNVSNTTQLATNNGGGVSATTGALTLQGDLHFYNGTKNTIVFAPGNPNPPSITNRSSGARIVLYPNISGTSVEFAMGIENGSIWYSVDWVDRAHKFYAGTTFNAQLSNGQLWIPTNTASTSSSTGALVVTGGVGIGGNVNVGGNVVVGTRTNSRPLCVSKSNSQGMISVFSNGDTRYHLYNSGGVTEWGFGQKSQSDHSFKLSTLISGAEVDTLTITTDGRVGMGNSTGPFGTLHLAENTTNCNIVFEAGNVTSGDVPGFTAINFNGYYSGGEQRINTAKNRWRIVCSQSGSYDQLSFETWNGSASLIPLLINPSGYMGFNNTNPQYPVHVSGRSNVVALYIESGDSSSNDLVYITKAQTGNYALVLDTTGSGYLLFMVINGANVGTITTNGTTTFYNTTSDYRLKQNIKPFKNAIDVISKLKVYKFNFKGSAPERTVYGFLAHEVSKIIPNSIHGKKDEMNADNPREPAYQSIDHSKLVPLITKSIQEIMEKNDKYFQSVNDRLDKLIELARAKK